MTLSPTDVWFHFKQLEHLDTIGDLTFYCQGIKAGSIDIGDQLFDYRQQIDKVFAGGYVARSPGLVKRQVLPVTLNGETIDMEMRLDKEIGLAWFGIRPYVVIRGPTGEHMFFSYRPIGFGGNTWCRVVPTVPHDLRLYRHYQLFSRLSWLAHELFIIGAVYVVVGTMAMFGAPAIWSIICSLPELSEAIQVQQFYNRQ